MNFLDRSLKTKSSNFLKTHSVAERFFHTDKQNEERTDMHDNAKSPFSQLFLDFNDQWNLERNFRKLTKRSYESKFTLFVSHYKCTAHLRKTYQFRVFLQTVQPISHYCRSGQHSYTSFPLINTIVSIRKFPISNNTL